MNDAPLNVAIVTPWYGADLTGGAERTAWQIAHGLRDRGHDVTVFTTCARRFASDWSVEAYRPTTDIQDGIVVRRYRVDQRDGDEFDRANEILLAQSPLFYSRHASAIDDAVASSFIQNSIKSSDLIADLEHEADSFAAVLVLPYLYAVCLDAVRAAQSKSVLVPCLHDEAYAYLPDVAEAFRLARKLAFNTIGESRLACRILGPAILLKSVVVGQWVDSAPSASHRVKRVLGFDPTQHRYLLYLGRRDATKNVDLLVESFATFRRRERMSNLELVLIGPGRRTYNDPRHGIFDFGEVSDGAKALLLSNAWGVVQPSMNESFSRAVMEAWSVGAPVAVNSRCEATSTVVAEAAGGWAAATKAEWSQVFDLFDHLSSVERDAAGSLGRAYVENQTSPSVVIARLETTLRSLGHTAGDARYDVRPSPGVMRRLADGRRTILFAGPLDERSGIESLLTAFAHLLSFGIDAKLVLLGQFPPGGVVETRFFDLVASARLGDRVAVLESQGSSVAAACYRSAALFWSMSDEGPASELVDALGYGVPVFAFKTASTENVLCTCGLIFREKDSLRALAAIAALILTDDALRTVLLDGQRRRFEALSQDVAHSTR